MFDLMELPFDEFDLEPVLFAQTIECHYGKHHKAYNDNLNNLIKNTEFENFSLEEIIKATYKKDEFKGIYNNAGQVYNHNVYWNTINPFKKLDNLLLNKIIENFGSIENFKLKLADEAVKFFGSGWAWLVEDKDGQLKTMATQNGDTPLVLGYKPILNIDVWEHAYYLDYQNVRKDYVENIISLLFKA